jgi:large subunit ribosomal protein L12
MEYVYAALLIHKAGGKIDEPTVAKVLEAAGVTVDQAKVKALIASLDGVNIDEAISKAAVPVAAAPAAAAPAAEVKQEEKKEEKPKDNPEAASAGLSALFG